MDHAKRLFSVAILLTLSLTSVCAAATLYATDDLGGGLYTIDKNTGDATADRAVG